MTAYTGTMNLTSEEIEVVMKLRHKDRKDKSIVLGNVIMFGLSDEMLSLINDQLTSLLSMATLLDYEHGVNVEILSQKRTVELNMRGNNRLFTVTFYLDQEDRIRKLLAISSHHAFSKELNLKSVGKKQAVDKIIDFFNEVRAQFSR